MDHSWTLQAVMQMQKDLGVLAEKIDRMREDLVEAKTESVKSKEKLSDIEKSIASAQGAIKVFGRLYALLLVVIAAFLAWFLRPVSNPIVSSVPDARKTIAEENMTAERVENVTN